MYIALTPEEFKVALTKTLITIRYTIPDKVPHVLEADIEKIRNLLK